MIRIYCIVILIISFLASCDDTCISSPSCLAPPEGAFVTNKINLAIYQDLWEKQSGGSFEFLFLLDSVIVNTEGGSYKAEKFYTWFSIDEAVISSVDVYSEGTQINIPSEGFTFKNSEMTFSEGGYLFTFIKEGDDFVLVINKASQDLIDGVCNDVVIDC